MTDNPGLEEHARKLRFENARLDYVSRKYRFLFWALVVLQPVVYIIVEALK